MKKKLSVFCIALLLCGCGNPSFETTTLQSPKHTVESTTTSESNVKNETSSPPKSQNIDLPNTESLDKELINILSKLGAVGSPEMDYISYRATDSGDIDIDFLVDTDLYSLRVSCMYIEVLSKWSIFRVSNDENKHCYYVAPGTEEMVDLYDYKTDALISEKSANPKTSSELMDDYEKEMESIGDDYDADLDSIADEYNVSGK